MRTLYYYTSPERSPSYFFVRSFGVWWYGLLQVAPILLDGLFTFIRYLPTYLLPRRKYPHSTRRRVPKEVGAELLAPPALFLIDTNHRARAPPR